VAAPAEPVNLCVCCERVCPGTPVPPPSVDQFVRLLPAASARPAPAGEVPSGAVCDPEGVSEPVVRPEAPAPEVAWVAPTWEQVVRDHSARVYRLAYRLSGNAQDAEDLTQETFVRVFRSLADFSPGTFEGWLHRITTNLFLDMVRRRQRIRFDALPEDTERLPGTSPSPEQVYADTHLDPQIQAALDALSPEFRVAVVLCDIEGLTYEEIAATLGIKLGTVRSRIHRGRVQLRQALAHLAPRPAGLSSVAAEGGGA
jgi:RNA polymerase sigma factor (sigma-70 family)